MAIVRVTTAYGEDFTGATLGLVQTGNFALAAGNSVLMAVGVQIGAASVSSVFDGLGNSYTLIGSFTDAGGYRQQLYLAQNVTGGTATVIVTWSAALPYRGILAVQYSGLLTTGAVDAFVTSTTGTVVSTWREITSPAFATTAASEVMVIVPRWGLTAVYPADASGGTPTGVTNGNLRWAELFLSAPRSSATYTYRQTTTTGTGFDGMAIVTLQAPGAVAVATANPYVWGPL